MNLNTNIGERRKREMREGTNKKIIIKREGMENNKQKISETEGEGQKCTNKNKKEISKNQAEGDLERERANNHPQLQEKRKEKNGIWSEFIPANYILTDNTG